jgi:hypothetical protein
MTEDAEPIALTACHEAGHMAAAWELGLTVTGNSQTPAKQTSRGDEPS